MNFYEQQAPAIVASDAARARAALKNKAALASMGYSPETITTVSPPSEQEPIEALIDLAAIGTHTIISGTPGFRIFILQLDFWSVGAQDIEFLGDARSISGPLDQFPANSGKLMAYNGNPHWRLRDGESFKVSLSAASQFSGYALYTVRQ